MWLKKNWANILLAVILLGGLGLICYPSFSNWWNSFHQSRAIEGYAKKVAEIDDASYRKMLKEARDYNESLLGRGIGRFNMTDEERVEYQSILNVDGNGIMGYIDIPKISVSLPLYHGTGEDVLQIAVGHVEGSSLPVGGIGTHTVLSGHRGLPSAKLFTDLDQLEKGDIFQITILDEVLTYQIDQIHIVLPNEMEDLAIDESKDLATLVTCTPYGVNSHRMLVRGHRIENPEKGDIRVSSDASQIPPLHVLPFVAAVIAVLVLIILGIRSAGDKRNLRAYRTIAEMQKTREKNFSMDYFYDRHPLQKQEEDRKREQARREAEKERSGRQKSGKGKRSKTICREEEHS